MWAHPSSSRQHPTDITEITNLYNFTDKSYSFFLYLSYVKTKNRIYSLYERNKKILVSLLSLTGLDYALQMSANHAATSIYLASRSPNLSICFNVPMSPLYSLVFISPTIFQLIVLGMTLYNSFQHIRATRKGGIKPIMHVVQRDQIFFILAICLINFANLVLVLQGSSWPYRLVSGLFRT